MSFRRAGTGKRHANLSVREDLLEAARTAGVNLSNLLEGAIEEELEKRRRRHWREENASGIEAYNRHIKRYGAFSTGLTRPGSG